MNNVIRILLVSLYCFIISACATAPADQRLASENHSLTADVPHVLLVNANHSVKRYQIAQQYFEQTLDHQVQITTIDLSKDKQPTETLQDAINQQHYSAIYCIGAKALGAVNYLSPETPVVYSSVLNWHRFTSTKGFYGVATNIAPKSQLTWFKHVFPKVERIGLLYSQPNQALISKAKLAADQLSIKIVAIKVDSNNNIPSAMDKLMPQVDALWLVSDSVVMASIEDIQAIMEQAHQLKKPIFAQNEGLAKLGATLVISSDLATMGRQAGIIVKRLLGTSTERHSVSAIQYPAGSHIILNIKEVEEYGLKLNEAALDSVNEVITQ